MQRIDFSYVREPESDAEWMRGSLCSFQLRLQLMRSTSELTPYSKLAEHSCLARDGTFRFNRGI
jgi:hypothetical protein